MTETIILAGMGRCGTTLLYNVVRDYNEFVMDLASLSENFKKFAAIKTHDFAPELLPSNTKAIYLFGNPIDIVLSAHDAEMVNVDQHYIHMHGDAENKHNFEYSDTLQLEANFDSWHKKQNYPLLTLRYETLWENTAILNDFLGVNIQLPERKRRTIRRLSNYEEDKMKETYSSIINKVNHAEDSTIWEV